MSDSDSTRSASQTAATEHEHEHGLAPMDFSTFVMSLGSSAMIQLGQVLAPGGKPEPIDLVAAKQIIDILDMLDDKTSGNLDDSEIKLLRSLLYDLRLKYVDARGQR